MPKNGYGMVPSQSYRTGHGRTPVVCNDFLIADFLSAAAPAGKVGQYQFPTVPNHIGEGLPDGVQSAQSHMPISRDPQGSLSFHVK